MSVSPETPAAAHARVSDGRLDVDLAARVVAVVIVSVFGAIAVRNALAYPPIGGYDAAEHLAYARSLIEHGELPYRSGSYYTPPLWYALAGAGTEAGEAFGMAEPERVGQLLNALLTTGAAVLVFLFARTLFPRRPLVAVAALAFFAACPPTLRMATMFHPQALALFLSTAGLFVVARTMVSRRYGIAAAGVAGVLLGAAELVRSVGIWSFGVASIALAAAVAADRERRRRAAAALAVVLVLGLAVPLPWYVYLQDTYGYAVFGRPPTVGPQPPQAPPPPAPEAPAAPAQPSGLIPPGRPPGSFFLRTGLPEVLTRPHRAELERSFWPTLYADTWGDAFGAWSWGPTREPLTEQVENRLALQSFAGLPLTFVAGAGWLALAALAVRRFRSRTELVLVVGMPAAALAGLLYYGIRSYEADLDFIKGMFALTAVPFWALGFGFAADGLWHRLPRPLGVLLAVVLAASLLVSLEFGIA